MFVPKELQMLKRLLCVVLASAVLATVAPLRAEILEQVLVKVNGDIVTKTEFEQRQVAELRQHQELANASQPQIDKAIADATPDLILSAVDELLLIQRGRELGYTMTDEQFNQIVDNIKKQNNLDDEAKFQAALKQEGMTMAELRQQIERGMLVSRVRQTDVTDKISVTDEEAKAYYAAHRNEFTTPSQLTLREILIEVPTTDKGVNVAADDAAKEKALEVRNRIMGGEPFAKVAAEVSASPSKTNGGLIGPISYDELAPALQKLVDGLKIGDISEPIRTTNGYQIFQLEQRTDTKIRTFEEARDDISRKVANDKSQTELLKYIDKLRDQATITWQNQELKKAYDQALAKRHQQLQQGQQAPNQTAQ
jgi:peptidyl-prolyl cis-trans isomerase SurA